MSVRPTCTAWSSTSPTWCRRVCRRRTAPRRASTCSVRAAPTCPDIGQPDGVLSQPRKKAGAGSKPDPGKRRNLVRGNRISHDGTCAGDPQGCGGTLESDEADPPVRLRPAAVHGQVKIVVEVSRLVFCGCTGLGAFIAAKRQAEQRGGYLRLVGVQRQLAKLLRLAELVDTFPPYADLRHACD
ncbi:STAS domain-containing protein [Nonomuraea polychroma]|uniref:STAS domain-containing protein n=1 Tax=Nonomuraea polychroma TaxID=46176 RepID=UPI003D941014